MDAGAASAQALCPSSEEDGMREVRRLAEFVAGIRAMPLPLAVLTSAKHLILDAIGSTIAGSRLPVGEMVRRAWSAVDGRGEATLLPSAVRVPALVAAYVNAHQTNLLDMDDTYMGGVGGHPGATIVPVALACAERAHASGSDLLAAVVAGYETSIRIGLALDGGDQPSDSRAWQAFGAAAAAAVLAHLSPGQVIDAVGLTGMNAPAAFMRKFHEPTGVVGWLKNNSGWIALGGLLAVDLAVHGMRGNRRFLDRDAAAILGGKAWRPEALVDGLGQQFKISAISFKRYSACYHLQTTLEAIDLLKRFHRITPHEVKWVQVDLVSRLAAGRFSFAARDIMDIPFSIPCVCALALADVPTGPDWIDPAALRSALIAGLSSRVNVAARPRADPDEPETASTVTIGLADGTRVTQTVRHPEGSPARPLSDIDIRHKFRHIAGPVIGRGAVAQVEAAVLRLEDAPYIDVSQWLRTADADASHVEDAAPTTGEEDPSENDYQGWYARR
jgi:2-methylcitrate dehydratase PrpD